MVLFSLMRRAQLYRFRIASTQLCVQERIGILKKKRRKKINKIKGHLRRWRRTAGNVTFGFYLAVFPVNESPRSIGVIYILLYYRERWLFECSCGNEEDATVRDSCFILLLSLSSSLYHVKEIDPASSQPE